MTKSLSPWLCILTGRDRTPNKQGHFWGHKCYGGNKGDNVIEVEGETTLDKILEEVTSELQFKG